MGHFARPENRELRRRTNDELLCQGRHDLFAGFDVSVCWLRHFALWIMAVPAPRETGATLVEDSGGEGPVLVSQIDEILGP